MNIHDHLHCCSFYIFIKDNNLSINEIAKKLNLIQLPKKDNFISKLFAFLNLSNKKDNTTKPFCYITKIDGWVHIMDSGVEAFSLFNSMKHVFEIDQLFPNAELLTYVEDDFDFDYTYFIHGKKVRAMMVSLYELSQPPEITSTFGEPLTCESNFDLSRFDSSNIRILANHLNIKLLHSPSNLMKYSF